MTFNFEDLTSTTRRWMLDEFEAETRGPSPYFSPILKTEAGPIFQQAMRKAIGGGDETSLARDLADPALWKSVDAGRRRVNVEAAVERLANTEFNTWYVRGFARCLLEENTTTCRVYRAALPRTEPGSCAQHEGRSYPVRLVYDGHRARYHPIPRPEAFSIPYEANCHHTIGRDR